MFLKKKSNLKKSLAALVLISLPSPKHPSGVSPSPSSNIPQTGQLAPPHPSIYGPIPHLPRLIVHNQEPTPALIHHIWTNTHPNMHNRTKLLLLHAHIISNRAESLRSWVKKLRGTNKKHPNQLKVLQALALDS